MTAGLVTAELGISLRLTPSVPETVRFGGSTISTGAAGRLGGKKSSNTTASAGDAAVYVSGATTVRSGSLWSM